MIRWIKIALVAFIGLHALFYAIQNLVNLDQAIGALGYVMSGADHAAYPDTAFFNSTSPTLAAIGLGLVLLGEFAVGLFGLVGAFHMLRARTGNAKQFHAAKHFGVVAAGLALLTWFGAFMTVGAAFFQMWQTELGSGSMEGAFMYAMASAITMIFVCVTED